MYAYRRGSRPRLAIFESSRELRVVIWYVNTNAQTAKDEECSEAIEDGIVSTWHDISWVFCFTSSLESKGVSVNSITYHFMSLTIDT